MRRDVLPNPANSGHSRCQRAMEDCFPTSGEHRRSIVTTLAFILAAALAPQHYQPGIRHDSVVAEPVILEVRIGTVASAVVVARRIGDIALLPVAPVLALVQSRNTDSSSEYLTTDSLAAI